LEKLNQGQELSHYDESNKENLNYVFCPECSYIETVIWESNLPNAKMDEIKKTSAREYKERKVKEKQMGILWVENPELPKLEEDVVFDQMKRDLDSELESLKRGNN